MNRYYQAINSSRRQRSVGLLVILAVLAGCVDGSYEDEQAMEDEAAFADDAVAYSLEPCGATTGSEPCYSQTNIASGPSWQLDTVSGVDVDGSGSPYNEEIYILNGAAGINESPLPDQIKTDLLYDAPLDDAVYVVSSRIVDEILLSQELGDLTPTLEAIAEPELDGGLELQANNPVPMSFARCSNSSEAKIRSIPTKNFSLGSTSSISAGFEGSLTTSGSGSMSATITSQFEKERFRYFSVRRWEWMCIPYSARFISASGQGNMTLNPSTSLDGSVSFTKTWERDLGTVSLGSSNFMIAGLIPIRLAFSLPIKVGLDLTTSVLGSVALDASQTAIGSFNFNCTANGCTGGTTMNFSGTQTPGITASASGRVQPAVWVQPAIRVALYDDDLAYIQFGVRPSLRGDLWEYHGNNCSDVDGNGIKETVDARTFDLDWQLHLTGQAAVFGNNPTKWNDLWHSTPKHILFLNLLGPVGLQPVLAGSSSAVLGATQTYTARMRSCWPYTDSVTYKLVGGGSSTTKSGAANTLTNINKSWGSLGTYLLSLTAQTDAHGRALNAVTERSVQVTNQTLPAPQNLWLRADAGVTLSSGKVSSWTDQSGNGNHAYMSTASRQPSFVSNVINGSPVIRFSGAQSLTMTNALSQNNYTVFVVGKNSQTSGAFSMILGPTGSGTNGNNQLRWENGTQALLVGLGNGMPVITSTIGNTFAYHVLSARYDGSQLKIYRDGNLISTTSFVATGPWELNQIGAWVSQYFMVGDIAEIVFYSSALSETNRTSANNYFKNKYALP